MSETIEEICIKKGVKLTDQRRVIAKVLSESKENYGESDHPDVDELYKRVSKMIMDLVAAEVKAVVVEILVYFKMQTTLATQLQGRFLNCESKELRHAGKLLRSLKGCVKPMLMSGAESNLRSPKSGD